MCSCVVLQADTTLILSIKVASIQAEARGLWRCAEKSICHTHALLQQFYTLSGCIIVVLCHDIDATTANTNTLRSQTNPVHPRSTARYRDVDTSKFQCIHCTHGTLHCSRLSCHRAASTVLWLHVETSGME